ncbi:amidohydrolase family protein [Maribacter sp. 2308TA10-17]|uniref:amidohydrolase family protein n=1 Tax=Maribacter sp. 2308TA10-17 TaxID=3386276 RepID=UPI0039BCBB23
MSLLKNSLKIFLCISILISCQNEELLFENAICIQNINTIDPSDGLKKNQTVIIKNGKIHKIVATDSLNLSGKNTIVDGTGKYLIPGLWDAHVHFAYIEEMAPSMFDLFLTHGITSVRDTGGKVDFVKGWKDKALANPTDAPRVMMAGPLLDGEPNVYDGSDAAHPELSVGLATVEDVTSQIEMLVSKNVDLLKAYEMLTPEQFEQIMALAKKNRLKVTGHVPLSMDAITASNLGLNSIEHMRNLEISCASNAEELWEQRKKLLKNEKNLTGGELRSSIHTAQREIAIANYDEERANKVLATLKKNDTWQIPTQALNTFFTRKYFARNDWQESYALLPDTIGQDWLDNSKALANAETPKAKEAWNQWNYMMVKKIHDTGIPIMAGTDTPIAFLTPGLSLHEELAVLVEDVGLSTLDALKAATINPAKYFSLHNELGSVKENMWADLVILDANPLENIKNTTKIYAVIKQGKLHDKDMLNARIQKLKN